MGNKLVEYTCPFCLEQFNIRINGDVDKEEFDCPCCGESLEYTSDKTDKRRIEIFAAALLTVFVPIFIASIFICFCPANSTATNKKDYDPCPKITASRDPESALYKEECRALEEWYNRKTEEMRRPNGKNIGSMYVKGVGRIDVYESNKGTEARKSTGELIYSVESY